MAWLAKMRQHYVLRLRVWKCLGRLDASEARCISASIDRLDDSIKLLGIPASSIINMRTSNVE